MKKSFKVLALVVAAAALASAVCAEDVVFRTRTEAEEQYIYEEMGSNDPGDGKSRYHDGYNYIIYQFPVAEGDQYADLTWKMQAQYKVSVYNGDDPDDWDSYEVIDINEPTEEELAEGKPDWGYTVGQVIPTYDLSKFVKEAKTDKIYVMMSDAEESNGWGGYIFGDFDITYRHSSEPLGEMAKPKTLAEKQADVIAMIEPGTQGFVVHTDTEKPYIVSEEGVGNSSGSKFLDGNGYVIYQFTVNPGDTYAGIEWVLNNQYKIEINVKDPADESAWVLVDEAKQTEQEIADGNADWGSRRFVLTPDLDKEDANYKTTLYIYRHDLSSYLEGNTGKVYIRMGDSTPENGWGGYISMNYPVTFKSGTSPITWKASGFPLFGTDFVETADTPTTPTETVDTPATPTETVDTPATPTETVDTPATPTETVETPAAPTEEAPQTFDAAIIAAGAAVVALAGYAVAKKRK